MKTPVKMAPAATGCTGLDPTLGQPLGMQHVWIGCGHDYDGVRSVRGVYKGQAGQRLFVDVRVRLVIGDGCEHLSESQETRLDSE